MGLAAVASTVLFGLLWIGFVYRGDPDFARGASSEDDED